MLRERVRAGFGVGVGLLPGIEAGRSTWLSLLVLGCVRQRRWVASACLSFIHCKGCSNGATRQCP